MVIKVFGKINLWFSKLVFCCLMVEQPTRLQWFLKDLGFVLHIPFVVLIRYSCIMWYVNNWIRVRDSKNVRAQNDSTTPSNESIIEDVREKLTGIPQPVATSL